MSQNKRACDIPLRGSSARGSWIYSKSSDNVSTSFVILL